MESLSLEDLEKSMRENRSSMLNLVVKGGYKDSNDLVMDDYDQEEEHDISKAGITNVEELTHDEHEGLDEEKQASTKN